MSTRDSDDPTAPGPEPRPKSETDVAADPEPNPHDRLFKVVFRQHAYAAELFRATLPAELSAGIDWDTLQITSETAVDPDGADQSSDLMFAARLRGDEVRLYALIEHQSSGRQFMVLRMLKHLVRHWEAMRREHPKRRLRVIIPVLVCHVPGGWASATSFHDLFRPDPASIPGLAELVPAFDLVVEDLTHMSNEDIRRQALAPLPTLALWLLRDARTITELMRNLAPWAHTLHKLYTSQNGAEMLGILFRYIFQVSRVNRQEFYAKLQTNVPGVEKIAMTTAEELVQEGLARGLEQGQRQMLRKLLAAKFGQVTAAHEERIDNASHDQLEHWLIRVLTADSIDAVFAESP